MLKEDDSFCFRSKIPLPGEGGLVMNTLGHVTFV